jgi:hypothetical protein
VCSVVVTAVWSLVGYRGGVAGYAAKLTGDDFGFLPRQSFVYQKAAAGYAVSITLKV